MRSNVMAVTTIPVTDLELALPFYRDVLGLAVLDQGPFSIRLDGGSGTQISIYKRGPVERGQTVCHFEVTDVEAAMADIRSRGGVLEEYDGPTLTTVNGIAQLGPARGGWLKDPEGNVIGLREGPIPGRQGER